MRWRPPVPGHGASAPQGGADRRQGSATQGEGDARAAGGASDTAAAEGESDTARSSAADGDSDTAAAAAGSHTADADSHTGDGDSHTDGTGPTMNDATPPTAPGATAPDATAPYSTASGAPAWFGDPGLLAAFWRYERALMTNDVPELDELFARGSGTVRSEAGSALVGHDAIAAFRAARPPVPRRSLRRVHLRPISADAAVIIAESVRGDRGTGAQTQLWQRVDGLWAVTVAHVSTVPGMQFSPLMLTAAEERAVWATPAEQRPLVSSMAYPDGTDRIGSLAGVRVAVKDLFAIAGETIGAGNPTFRAGRGAETDTAPAVTALLREGAELTGLAQTDELAFSIAGTNVHYGTPPNPAAPGRIPGGSTSGPASAVALGLADLGLGTDTAGSIRVPGSYTGLFGLRTTHDAVSRAGLVPLAPSFDTVGVLARELSTLEAGARAILATGDPLEEATGGASAITRLVVDPALVALADPETQLTFQAGVRALALVAGVEVVQSEGAFALDPAELEQWFDAFRTVQQYEAWASDREFVEAKPGALDPAIAERFRVASGLTENQALDARQELAQATARLEELVPSGSALVLPSTSGPAPTLDATPAEIDRVRGATLRLTCLASFSGLPALTLPFGRVGTLPVGVCLVGARGADLQLIELAKPRP